MKKALQAFAIASLFGLTGNFAAGMESSPQQVPSPAPSESPTPAPTPEYRALRVVLRGGFAGFDEGAYYAFRSLAGALVTQGTLGSFITEVVTMDGGGVFCLQLEKHSSQTIEGLMAPFSTIHVNTVNTTYTLTPVPSCDLTPGLF